MQYSAFLAAAVLRNVVLPLVIASLATHLFRFHPPWTVRLPGYAVALAINFWILSYISLAKQTCIARRLHPQAIPVPRVKGRWPLNLDVMVDWMESSKGEYLGEGMISKLEERYGKTMNTRVLGEDSIITTSVVHVSHILGASFAAFDKGPKWKERVREMIGDGVFGSDGELWKFHRATTRPFFTRSRLSLGKILEPHTSNYISVLRRFFHSSHTASNTPPPFDIQELTRRLTLDVAMSWFCGHSTGLLEDSLGTSTQPGEPRLEKPEGVKVFEAFAEAQAVAAMRIKIGTLWSLFEWRKNKMEAPMKTIRSFIRPIVASAIRNGNAMVAGVPQRTRDGDDNARSEETLLDYLAQSLDDPNIIEDEIINILVAASDTTAAAMTACVYCLAMYPDCLTTIAEESDKLSLSAEPMADDLGRLQYLNAFIHEVLRLYPPVPLNIRRSNQAVLLPPLDTTSAPLVFPADTSVILSTLSIQRDQSVWGPDAQAFDPCRWLESDPRAQKGYPFGLPGFGRAAFPAFHLGPRTASPGQTFAIQQLAYTILQLVRTLRPSGENAAAYRLTFATETQRENTAVPARWKTLKGRGKEERAFWSSNITLYFKGGLWMQIVQEVD